MPQLPQAYFSKTAYMECNPVISYFSPHSVVLLYILVAF